MFHISNELNDVPSHDHLRLMKLHEKLGDLATELECFSLALENYKKMVGTIVMVPCSTILKLLNLNILESGLKSDKDSLCLFKIKGCHLELFSTVLF